MYVSLTNFCLVAVPQIVIIFLPHRLSRKKRSMTKYEKAEVSGLFN